MANMFGSIRSVLPVTAVFPVHEPPKMRADAEIGIFTIAKPCLSVLPRCVDESEMKKGNIFLANWQDRNQYGCL